MNPEKLPLEKLQSEFGKAVEIRAANTRDAVEGVLPSCAAAPRSEDAARELISWCGKNDVAFIPRGGGTKLHIGAPPSRCDLIISTKHLKSVVEHDEGNATVQAGSGISLADLNQVVGERGQFVPFDRGNYSWNSEVTTLGGIVASNHFGASRLRYGAPRDLVVGLHAVLSDGRFVKAGSKVVKNVSGYDLNKLFIGSFGTLGLITEVTIRLRPNDAVQKDWGKMFTSWAEAEMMAQQIFNGAFEPAILRVVAQKDKVLLRARFDGGEASVNAQLSRLPQSEMNDAQEFADANELEIRAQLPLMRAAKWAQQAQALGATRVLWDCGLGAVRAEWENATENTHTLVESLRASAIQNEGFVVVERAPSELKTSDFVWGEKKSDFALMQNLKSVLDKANVCAPGRFVGGI